VFYSDNSKKKQSLKMLHLSWTRTSPFHVIQKQNIYIQRGKNGFVMATKLGTTNIFFLQPKTLLQQPNVLLIELNILLL